MINCRIKVIDIKLQFVQKENSQVNTTCCILAIYIYCVYKWESYSYINYLSLINHPLQMRWHFVCSFNLQSYKYIHHKCWICHFTQQENISQRYKENHCYYFKLCETHNNMQNYLWKQILMFLQMQILSFFKFLVSCVFFSSFLGSLSLLSFNSFFYSSL